MALQAAPRGRWETARVTSATRTRAPADLDRVGVQHGRGLAGGSRASWPAEALRPSAGDQQRTAIAAAHLRARSSASSFAAGPGPSTRRPAFSKAARSSYEARPAEASEGSAIPRDNSHRIGQIRRVGSRRPGRRRGVVRSPRRSGSRRSGHPHRPRSAPREPHAIVPGRWRNWSMGAAAGRQDRARPVAITPAASGSGPPADPIGASTRSPVAQPMPGEDESGRPWSSEGDLMSASTAEPAGLPGGGVAPGGDVA